MPSGASARAPCNLGIHIKISTQFAAPVLGLYAHGNLGISPRGGDESSIAKIVEGDVGIAPSELPLNFG